jgi:hypothetical protein
MKFCHFHNIVKYHLVCNSSLRIFRVLRRIFGSKRDDVTVEWRGLHNEELYALYFSPDIIRVIKKNEIGRACSVYGGEERCIHDFGGETRGKEST